MLYHGLFRGNIECTLSHFAGVIKWAGDLISWRVGRLQKNLDRLNQWAKTNCTKFNNNNFQVLPLAFAIALCISTAGGRVAGKKLIRKGAGYSG